MDFCRRIFTGFARGTALLLWVAGALAQGFPDKPVRLIVPFPPGGGADTSVRILVEPLSRRLGQQVVVDNRAGAGGIIGVRALKQADPDGHTIGLVVSGNTIQPFTTKALGFDVRKDFIPLSLVYTGPLVMTVLDSFPARTLNEFIDYAKANPGKVFYASAGTGTTTHLSGEMLGQVTGVPCAVQGHAGRLQRAVQRIGADRLGQLPDPQAACGGGQGPRLACRLTRAPGCIAAGTYVQ